MPSFCAVAAAVAVQAAVVADAAAVGAVVVAAAVGADLLVQIWFIPRNWVSRLSCIRKVRVSPFAGDCLVVTLSVTL